MKLIKRTFLFLTITLSFLLGAVTIIATQYEEEVISFVKIELGSQLSRSVDVGTIEYDLFENFPNVSVSLNGVKTYSFEKGDKPFLDLQRIYLVFDLMSLINGDFNVNQIILEEGEVNIVYNKKGEPNYNIIKDSKDTPSSNSTLSIDNVVINEVKVGYFDWKENHEYTVDFSEGTVTPISLKDSVVAEVNFISKVQPLKIDDFKTSKSIPLEGNLSISIKNGEFKFQYKGDLNGNSSELKGLTYLIDDKEFWDYDFLLENHNANSLISILPEYLKDKGMKSITGVISAKVSITGEKANNKSPKLNVEYKLSEASYQNGNHKLEDVFLNGTYIQPNLNNWLGAQISASFFKVTYEGIKISGSGELNNFKRPLIEAKIQSEFELPEIYDKLLSEDFDLLEGKVVFDMNLKGRLVEIFADNNLKSLDKFKSEGTFILEDIIAQPKDFHYPINISNGKLNFSGKDLILESFEGSLKSSKFKMNGQITNYLKTVLAHEPLTFDANLEMDKMVLEEFVGGGGDSTALDKEPYNFTLPKSILLRTRLKMGEFTFRKFKGENISGDVTLKNQILTFDNLNLKTCNGLASSNGSIDSQYSNKVVYKTKTILKDIDAKQAFFQFENFGQDVLLERHVDGKVSMETSLIVESDKELNLDENKIYSETKLNIKDGELEGFEPLIELQKFLKNDLKLNFNLSHLKFSTLKNDIKISQGTIVIPEMAIRSSDINLDIEGTHTFNQDIDYLLKIKHSEIFKATRQNKIDEEFGVVENNDKTATLPLRMKGNLDDPKFSYDVKSKRELVKENWKKERKKIGEAFKEEFSDIFKPKDKKKEDLKENGKEEEELEDLNRERTKVTQELVWEEEEEEEEE